MVSKSNSSKKSTQGTSNTALRIQSQYDSMGKAEKRLADWLIKNPNEIISLSIVELAEKTGVSEATVVRFSRKLSFSGYQELKIAFAQDGMLDYQPIHESISENDSCIEIANKIFAYINETLEHTRKILNNDEMKQAAEYIMNARNVVIFGLGNSASVALDAQHKLLREGINSVVYSDNHMQAIAASHLSENDVVIAISHSGSSKDIVEALKISKSCGAKNICITNYGKSPILKASDIALFTASDETRFRILGLSSRIAQLAIIDSLYVYIALRRSDEAVEDIKRAEKALQDKKY